MGEIMKFWIWLLSVLEAEMEVPRAYGWFHLLWVGLVIGFTIFLCIKMRDCSDKVFRRFCLIVAIVLIVADLYRQIVYDMVRYDATAEKFVWDYGWYAFPFQLCSSVHYLMPFIILMKDGRVRDACISFMCFFSTLGGVCVFLFPSTCFTPSIGVNIQTMLHHGMQIVLGAFFTVHERKKLGLKYFAKGIPTFLVLVSIAILLNHVVNNAIVASGSGDVFDMFYISPYYATEQPVVGVLKAALPYPVFLLLYIAGITAGALIIYWILIGIMIAARSVLNKIKDDNAAS